MAGKKTEAYKEASSAQANALTQQNQILEKSMQPTAAETRFNTESESWDKFIRGKDYSLAPAGTSLNFDLFSPAMQRKQSERLLNLSGIGGTGLSGGGNPIAGSLAKQHLADQTAEISAQSYENAIKATDDYYKGNALDYSGFEQNRLGGLLDNATQREQVYQQAKTALRPQSFLPQLFGAAVGIGSQFIGNSSPNASNPNLVSTVKPNIGKTIIARPLQALPTKP